LSSRPEPADSRREGDTLVHRNARLLAPGEACIQAGMTARIYKPAKTAMQSGWAKTRDWVLDYEPEEPRVVESLMGWTTSGDMKSQLRLSFDSKEEAIAYCERYGIPYRVFESKPAARRGLSYADNFAHSRRTPWTH
jgi:hypothetical protein